jgi:hypothetical protein
VHVGEKEGDERGGADRWGQAARQREREEARLGLALREQGRGGYWATGRRGRPKREEGEGEQAGLDAGGLGCFLFSFSFPFSISFLISKLKSI